MISFGDAIGVVASAQARMKQREAVLKLWEKSFREPLSKEEKGLCIAAYHDDTLPRVKNHNLYQWVEDGCPSHS